MACTVCASSALKQVVPRAGVHGGHLLAFITTAPEAVCRPPGLSDAESASPRGAAQGCWAHPWRAAMHAAALAAMLSALSGFAGLFVLHSYLAATNQTTYELSAGARVRPVCGWLSGPLHIQ